MTALASSPFEVWAAREGYNTAPAVSPSDIRIYADRDTQAVYEAWNAGKQHSLKATIGELKAEANGIAVVCSR
jgi:hypothetical protein